MNKFGNSNFELKLKARKRVKQKIKHHLRAISSCSIRKQKYMSNLSLGFLIEQLLIAREWYLVSIAFAPSIELPNLFI